MFPLHDAVVVPLLEAVDARTILEIGADQGEHTELLQAHCADLGDDAHLHVIETDPSERLLDMVDDRTTTVHVGTSHDRIPVVPVPDAAMVDGDHNYWTVAEELRFIAERAAEADRPLPLLCFHDAGWPYGRRDMYYAPERIPDAHRQPYAVDRAIRLGSRELTGPPGFNLGFANALVEGGPRNGVLTAVEDFAAGCEGARLVVLPALHGFAVLASAELQSAHPDLVAVLDAIAADGPQRAALAVVEHERLVALQQVMDEAWVKAHAERDLAEARDDLAAAEEALAGAHARAAAAEQALDAVRSSRSYRLVTRLAGAVRRAAPGER